MKLKRGDFVKVTNPLFDDKYIGDIAVVIRIEKEYTKYPYRCRYLVKHRRGYNEEIFAASEIKSATNDEAMVEAL